MLKLQTFRLPTSKLQSALSMKIFLYRCLELSKRPTMLYKLSSLFQMLVALKTKVCWPEAVLKGGT